MTSHSRLLRTVVTHPLTWAAIAVVTAAEWAFASWFQPPLPVLGAALAMGVALLLVWPLFLLRSPGFLAKLYEAPESLRRDKMARLSQLEDELHDVGSKQGLEQLRVLEQKMKSLNDVLKRRLNAGEVTYGRYLGTAEQVYLAALDNLHDVAIALTSIGGIDRDYVESRLRELARNSTLGDEQRRETSSLEERRVLLERQERQVSDLLARNEAAMTALDNTAAALAETRTAKGRASMDADVAMRELEQLAERARKYSAASG